ncbi:hypothetical protein QJS04_geneDACA000547 [Acorus gramineus]|uniref:Rubisco LSMT substrate-binding domain-containing protein n=1 Tax=Acorus gramineus TaxID=55184 RepID=A0AAV9AR63_ACOGR|nr:hypothetical protein QJS04_geneDACA000547 [Acorus gramineus]
MAVSSISAARLSFSSPFECRSDPSGNPRPENSKPPLRAALSGGGGGGNRMSSLIYRFPPNFVRQLSIKARRNCSNIGVAQVVAASWANSGNASPANNPSSSSNPNIVNSSVAPPSPLAAAVVAADAVVVVPSVDLAAKGGVDGIAGVVHPLDPAGLDLADIFSSDSTRAIHAGEKYQRIIDTDSITTPIYNTSAYWFKDTAELIDFKEGRHKSFEYGRYGNPTTEVLEAKMSGETGVFPFVKVKLTTEYPHLDAYSNGFHSLAFKRLSLKSQLMLVLGAWMFSATIIDPADIDSLKSALDQNNVSLFFTESPTNPYLRCVDIEKVSQLCHSKGALVCIDGTFATPINQKALDLGADLVMHSATKFIEGHNDVLGGCVSGSEKVISEVRRYHNIVGGVVNPNAAYMMIRGLKTLKLRVEKQNITALRMARILEEHPKIQRVYYPGLPSHPDHHIAKKQMSGFGGVVSFEVAGDLAATRRFVDATQIPYIAPSFGGVESFIDPPVIMSYWDLSPAERAMYGMKDNLVRFSFGIEDFEDLKTDILQALEAVETIIEIPKKLWINPDTIVAFNIGGFFQGLDPQIVVALFLTREKGRPDSAWRQHIDCFLEVSLIPLYSGELHCRMPNHSPSITTEDITWEIKSKGYFPQDLVFSLRTPTSVKAGEQVYIQYDSDKSNAEMALEFGLIESRPDRSVYTLMWEVPKSDPSYGDKVDILESEGLKGTEYFKIVLGQALPPDMLPYLRLVALGGTDAFLLEESMFRNSIWGHLELPVSRANEELICLVIRDACKSALSAFHTTIEKDLKLRESGNLSPRLEIAIGVREGKNKVLQQIDDILKDRATQLDGLYYQERKDQRSGTGL